MNLALTIGILAVSTLLASAQQPGTPAPGTTPAPQTGAPAAAGQTGISNPALPGSAPDSKSAQPSSSEATPPATPSTPPSDVDNAHYIIGPDDLLQITVWREQSFSGSFPVRPDGMISMVLIGDVPAAGLTPTQLGIDLGQRLRNYVQDPNVTVQVMQVNSKKIYLIGEVGHVGPIPLTADMSPLKAIASAGGLSPFANAKHIYILRGSGSTQQKIPFNYKQALKGDDRQQIVLRPGDTIVVPGVL